ncbi:MAG: hypothetical protein NWE79_03875, partial [Candidatus Bathyarchaeota archaeon]|nr:hypothetical protein [Candidatus Bathyarchaeota archaeon]
MRWNRVIGLAILALMLVPSFGVALAADVIDIWTDEASYEPGENVEVEGYTNVTETVTIIITNSSGHEILSLTDDPDEDGEFSANFQLDENAAEGTYGVNATVGEIYKTTSFEVDAEVTEGEEGENPSDFSSSEDLTCAIDRAFRYIDKVNTTAIALDQEGYNMTYFRDTLEELNDTLTVILFNMTNNLITPEEAVEKFSELRGGLGRLNGLLHSCTKKVKEEKTERYIEHMEKRINSTIDKIERFETDNGEKLRGALEAQKRKLWRLRLTLNATNLDDTIEALEDIT